jgi:phage gpG-like protein
MIEASITGDDRVIARLEKVGPSIRQALHDAMRAQVFRIQHAVVTEKLSGDPLHRRTAVLATSINSTVEDRGSEIVGRVGTKVRYGEVHEYGGTFEIPEHERRTKDGKTTTVRAHTATYPERSFLRSVLSELRPSVVESIRATIARAAMEA